MINDLTPEDFSGRVAGHVTSSDPFDRFVEAGQFATRVVFINRGFELRPPVIIVANDVNAWPLTSPGGTLATTLPWLREQMGAHQANWFFFAQPTQVGWYHEEGKHADTSDPEYLAKYGDQVLVPGVFWYAAARSGSWYVRRTGIARFLEHDLSPFRDGPADQGVAAFDAVLA